MLMSYNAEIVRGWPYDGSLDRAEPIQAGQTLSNGDWVSKQSDNTVALSGATKTAAAGLVVRGNGDSGSGAYSSKATVVWGNFIAKISNYTAGAWAPGSPVTIASGKVTLGVQGTDPIIGYVLDVNAGSTGNTAHLVIKFN